MEKKELKLIDKYGNLRLGYKLDREAIENTLTAHGLGMLRIGGMTWFPKRLSSAEYSKGCIMQVVENEPDQYRASDINKAVATWFDQNYDPRWTAEEFLDAMEKAGIF